MKEYQDYTWSYHGELSGSLCSENRVLWRGLNFKAEASKNGIALRIMQPRLAPFDPLLKRESEQNKPRLHNSQYHNVKSSIVVTQ